MINRILIVIFASLFLAACGGGGGGGGGTTATNAGSDNNTGGNDSSDQGSGDEQEEQAFTQEQSEYLPLIDGRGWSYFVTSSANAEGGQSPLLAQQSGTPGVYDLTSILDDTDPEAVISITQKYSSTKISAQNSEIAFHGFTGQNLVLPLPQELVDQASPWAGFLGVDSITALYLELNSIAFTQAVKVIGSDETLAAQTASDSLEANVSLRILNQDGDPLFSTNSLSLGVQAEVDNEDATPQFGSGEDTYRFKGRQSNATLDLTGPVNLIVINYDLEFRIEDNSIYVPGIGVAKRTLNVFADGNNNDPLQTIELTWDGMNGLPEPVIYELFQADPIALSEDVRLRIASEEANGPLNPFNPQDYQILNSSALDDLPWLTVQEEVASTAYIVSMSAMDLPAATTSTVVYVGADDSDTQFPVNITFSVD